MSMFEPLRNPLYARLFAAQVIALLGTGLTTVALALLAFQLAGAEAGKVLGTALAIKMVAYVMLSPLASSLTTMLPRKRLLIGLDLLRAICVGTLPFVSQLWHIYALIFFMQACSACFTPTFQAVIPDVFEDEARYTKALSLSRLAYDFEALVSPALAGAALLLVSFDALFTLNATAFLISAALIVWSKLPLQAPVFAARSTAAQALFGLRSFLATPRLRGLFAMSLAAASGGAMVIVNSVVYVRGSLGLGEGYLAALLAAYGTGSICMAFLLPRLLQRLPDRTVMLSGGAAMLIGLCCGAVMPGFAPALAIWVILGAGYAAITTPSGRLLRRSAQQGDRPAFFAAQFSLSHACFLLTYVLAGWLGADFGLPTAFLMLAGIACVAMLCASRVWPARDPETLEHQHCALDHTHLHVHDAHHQHAHEGWEGPEPHAHPHYHAPVRHAHAFVIDAHHAHWPR
ncbi:MAG: MFS transporter [Pseudomonadota bacterium]